MDFNFPLPGGSKEAQPRSSGLTSGLVPVQASTPVTSKSLDLDYGNLDDILASSSDDNKKLMQKKGSKPSSKKV